MCVKQKKKNSVFEEKKKGAPLAKNYSRKKRKINKKENKLSKTYKSIKK